MKTLDAAVAGELIERLWKIRAQAPARWGKMNAHQMVCHLTDAYGLAMGLKIASEDVNFLSRTVARWFALRVPLPWPHGVPTRPEMDQLVGGTPPQEFARDVAELEATIRRFARAPRDFQFSRHPIFGGLSEWEWLRWGYLHADHHLRQFGV